MLPRSGGKTSQVWRGEGFAAVPLHLGSAQREPARNPFRGQITSLRNTGCSVPGRGTQPARWRLAFPNPLLHLSYQLPERCGLLLPSTAGTGLGRAGWAPPGRALPFTGTGWAGPFAPLGRAEPGPGVTAAAGLPEAFLGGKPRAEVGGFVVRVPKAMADRSPPGREWLAGEVLGTHDRIFFFFFVSYFTWVSELRADVARTLARRALVFLKEERFFPCVVKSGGRWPRSAKWASFQTVGELNVYTLKRAGGFTLTFPLWGAQLDLQFRKLG